MKKTQNDIYMPPSLLTGELNMLTKQSFLEAENQPSFFDRRKNFELQCVNLWTLEEVYRYFDEHPDLDKIEALGKFIKMMDNYACMARTERTKTM